LFYGYLSLREHDAFLDEKDDLALMSLLLGFPLDDFASTLEREACEARSLLNRIADMIVQDLVKKSKHKEFPYDQFASDTDEQQTNLVKAQNLIKQFGLASDNCRILVQVQERDSPSPICFNPSSSLCSSPLDIVGEVISLKVLAVNPTIAKEDRDNMVKNFRAQYWLQAFGCEEKLFGTKPIIQSRYVQTCLRLDKPLYFKLVEYEKVTDEKKRCVGMINEFIKQEEERKKPQSSLLLLFFYQINSILLLFYLLQNLVDEVTKRNRSGAKKKSVNNHFHCEFFLVN